MSLERRVSFVDAPFTTAPLAVAVALFTFEALTRELLTCEPLTSDAFIMRYSESFYRSTHTSTHTPSPEEPDSRGTGETAPDGGNTPLADGSATAPAVPRSVTIIYIRYALQNIPIQEGGLRNLELPDPNAQALHLILCADQL